MSPMSAYDSIEGPVLLSKTANLFKFSLKNWKNFNFKKSHRMVRKQKMGFHKFIFLLAENIEFAYLYRLITVRLL